MTPPEPFNVPSKHSIYPLIAWACIGIVVTLAGTILMLMSEGTASFGWFAYAPLSEDSYAPFLPFFTVQEKIGLGTGIIGITILVFCGGWAFGRRDPRN